ncbi:MAG: hypothetical protein NVS3B1_07820 [Marmoricola sp.]
MAGESEPPTHSVEGIKSRAQLISTRRKRYTAQALEVFEEALEKPLRRRGLLDDETREGVETAKAVFRRKLSALEADAIEIMNLADQQMETNGYATQITDRLHPEGAAGLSRGAR